MRQKWSLILILFAVIMLGTSLIAGGVIKLAPLATISQYEGIHPQFIAIYHKDNYYTSVETHEASNCRIHPASIDFDPDKYNRGLPNLMGELRDIQIIRDLARYEVGDAYSHIVNIGGSPQPDGPYKYYEWDIEDIEGNIHKYRMELWLCSLQVNLWANPDVVGWWGGGTFNAEQMGKKYDSTEVWLKLEVGPDWYFEDANKVYFGLAYMELAEFSQLAGHEDKDLEVIPESKWSAFSIYNSLGGKEESVSSPTNQASKIQGKMLNPNVFKEEWYTPITVDSFGTFDYHSIGGGYNTHSVQWRILVHVFVVGEWVVKPEEERDMETHESTTREDPWDWIANWWADPLNRIFASITSFLAFIVIIVIVLALTGWLGPLIFYFSTRKR